MILSRAHTLLSHVLFMALALAPAACALDEPGEEIGQETGEAEQPLATTRIRLMAANITSGNNQSYDPGHGTRIFQGTDPDVVMIQEFNYGANTTADIRGFVDAAFGASFSYYREAGAQIPNGIVSRYPIIASGEWDDTSVSNRDFAWARIDIPGPVDLWAVSVHLLTASASARSTEAQQLVSYINQHVPVSGFLAIGGDFNTGTRSEGCVSTLGQVVVTGGSYPADRNGNTNTNLNRSKPYDWVLVDPDLNAYKTSLTLGGSVFENGLVADTRVYSPISEISPALSSDSGGSYMQHMAVLRDFLVPGDGSSPPPSGGGLFLNEILANESGSDAGGEVVEIVNGGASAADLSGYTVADAAGTRHTFAAGTSLAAGKAVVVFGGASAVPAGLANAVAASTGTLGLSNSGDTVTLRNASGATVDSYTYASSLSSTDGVSMNRSPDADPSGSFVLHTSVGAGASSPGKRASGVAF